MTALTVAGLFSLGDPHRIAARLPDQDLTLGCLLGRSAALAARLRRDRVTRMGLFCSEGHGLVIGLLAAAQAGCALVMPPGDQPDLLAELSGAWEVLVGDGPGMMPVWAEDGAASFAPVSDIALDFFTSGSTAKPKKVERRLWQLEREVQALAEVWPGHGWGYHHATVPHQHVYGLIFKLLWPLLCGRAFVSRTHQVWEAVQDGLGENDVLISSPAHLNRLGGLGAMARPALLLSAGAPLPPASAAQAQGLFQVVPVEIFGSTETGVMAWRPATDGQAWTPMPGNVIGCDDDGRLSLSSPWVAGRHRGSDMITCLPDGGFHLAGRAGRAVKIEGKRVGLASVENALRALAQVDDAAVFKLTGSREQLAAVVVASASGRDELARLGAFRFGRLLRQALAGQFEPLARPRLWRFVAEMPCNDMGKRLDGDLAALFSPLAGDRA